MSTIRSTAALSHLRYFIKTGICTKLLSKIVHDAFDVRQVSDYEDFAVSTLEQAQQQFDNAVLLIEEVERIQALLTQGKISLPIVT